MRVSWEFLLDNCSRIHTSRIKKVKLGRLGEMERDDARKVSVQMPDGTAATVVPTRLHEPGFYVRAYAIPGERTIATNFRSPGSLRMFKEWVDDGRVTLWPIQEDGRPAHHMIIT